MRTNNKKSLRFESMEPRLMMAGDVKGYFIGPDLQLDGDTESNQIVIQTIATGVYRVSGAPGTSTTVNGKAYDDFTVTAGSIVDIEMMDGDDLVRLDNVLSSDHFDIKTDNGMDVVEIWNSNLSGNVAIDTGASDVAHDTVDIQNSGLVNLAIQTHAENDHVYMNNVGVTGSTDIDLGTGGDTVDILNSTLAKTTIYGGDGNDTVTLDNDVFTQRVFISGGKSPDVVDSKNNTYNGDLVIRTDDGSDEVRLAYDQVFRDLDIATGNHSDDVRLEGVTVGRYANIALDGGNDVLDVAFSRFYGAFTADGGPGSLDAFSDTGNIFAGTRTLRRFP